MQQTSGCPLGFNGFSPNRAPAHVATSGLGRAWRRAASCTASPSVAITSPAARRATSGSRACGAPRSAGSRGCARGRHARWRAGCAATRSGAMTRRGCCPRWAAATRDEIVIGSELPCSRTISRGAATLCEPLEKFPTKISVQVCCSHAQPQLGADARPPPGRVPKKGRSGMTAKSSRQRRGLSVRVRGSRSQNPGWPTKFDEWVGSPERVRKPRAASTSWRSKNGQESVQENSEFRDRRRRGSVRR